LSGLKSCFDYSIKPKQNEAMKKFILTCIAILTISATGAAQEIEIPKTQQGFDVAIGVGEGIFSGALMWQLTHGISKSNKWRLGYGLRFSGFGGSNLTYITAPASLTSDEATIDTFNVRNPLTMGLSAVIIIEYQLSNKLRFGFNIDAIGFGFGNTSDGTFASSSNDGNFPTTLDAAPTSLNLLLVGDNDIGQLKSEFYVGYAFSEKFQIRGGLDMTFSEYTTSQELTNNNDRFRYKAMMFFVGITYVPFW
jgi:hypothetical protein